MSASETFALSGRGRSAITQRGSGATEGLTADVADHPDFI